MDLPELNTLVAGGTFVFTAIGAISAGVACSTEKSQLNARLTRCAAAFGTVAAVLGLIAYLTGRQLHDVSEGMIASLQKEIRGPDLSNSQLATLTRLLTSVPKLTDPVYMMSRPNKGATELAREIKLAFEAAGFAVDGVWEDVAIGGIGPGIIIRQKAKNGLVGTEIATALKTVGLDSRLVELNGLPESRIEIIVAYQP